MPAASASARFITLSANSRPASFEITRITTPNAPEPSFSTGVYRVESAAFVHTVGATGAAGGALDGLLNEEEAPPVCDDDDPGFCSVTGGASAVRGRASGPLGLSASGRLQRAPMTGRPQTFLRQT